MISARNDVDPLAQTGAFDQADPSAQTGAFDQIDALCASFTQDWDRPQRPVFEHYLAQVAENAQPTLLRNLLHVEIQRRRACGEQPTAEEYIQRFPQLAALIRQAFYESSGALTGSFAGETPTRPQGGAPVPAASRLGEYQLVRELGRGGMGAVYEAVHSRRGNRVALKILPQVDGAKLHLFKREFRSLADVNHPNLIGLHSLESDGCHWFFTMDLLAGCTEFLTWVRPGRSLDLVRLRAALAQLVGGVLALHSRHIIHRDLKPSNVMVMQDGRVIILDFGLVLEGEQSVSGNQIAGTPKYMAPEQAAGDRVTASADWYAVGVMLYEALCGKAPFEGSMLQVMQAKQKHDAPPLEVGPEIPEDLAALAMALLQRGPSARPGARAIVKVVAAQGSTSTETRVMVGTGLVGREQQLTALNDAHQTFHREQKPLVVFVSGRSGEGKTALVEAFLEPLRKQKHNIVIMAGRCYDRESVPFKALDSLIDALASYLRSLPEKQAALLLPDDIALLVQVFPVLQRVEVIDEAPRERHAALDEQQIRQRAFRALRKLVTRISNRTPILWVVDDLQWGDADSAEALFEVLHPPEAPTIFFLGTYRSDEADDSVFLARWDALNRQASQQIERRDVSVGPLTTGQCTQLVVNLLGRDGEVIRERAAEFAIETGGNPFLLIELVSCFDPATDSFEVLPIHEVIDRKLGRLPVDAAGLLRIVAISGQALSVAEASQAVGQSVEAVATLSHMRNERLIRLIGTEDNPKVDTYHDRIRETVVGHLDDGSRRDLHRTLAEVIEQSGAAPTGWLEAMENDRNPGEVKAIPRVYDLAYHFDAAGETRKALTYSLLAAEQARRQSALEVAAQQYAVAARNATAMNDLVRYRIAEGSSEALMLLGRYDEARLQLRGAIDLVSDPVRKARVEILEGETASRQGELEPSRLLLEAGLRRLGAGVPRSQMGYFLRFLREIAVQTGHSLIPWRQYHGVASRRDDLINHAYYCLYLPYIFQDTIKLAWCATAGMNNAERCPPSAGLAYNYGQHAAIMSMLGWNTRGRFYGNWAIAMAREFDDILTMGLSCTYQGVGCYCAARYEEGLEVLNEAISAFEKAVDQWNLHLARFHKGCCHFGLGDLEEALAEARWTFSSSARTGDSRTMCSAWLWARATRGNIPFDELRGCIPCRPDDVMSTVHALLAEGYWHTFHNRTRDALALYEKAATLVRTSLCVNSHTILVMPMLVMGLRQHADILQGIDAVQAKQLRRQALNVSTWGIRLTWLFPAAYPVALREHSLILAATGSTQAALCYADRSCTVALAQKARYEHAQSLLVRGQLAKQLGRPEADEQIRTAQETIEVLERPVREAVVRPPTSSPTPLVPSPVEPAQPSTPKRGWTGTIVALVALLAVGIPLGHVAGRSVGYLAGYFLDTAAGADLGGFWGRIVLPLVLLATGLLIRWGQRHHATEVLRDPVAVPNPPPALVQYSTIILLAFLGVSIAFIPVALSLWLGGIVGGLFGLLIPLLIWFAVR